MMNDASAPKLQALILAAGYATRLYPLTRVYPKPLLEVKGRPIINYIVDKLCRIGRLDEIIVVTNAKFIGRFLEWKAALRLKKPVTLIDDKTKDNSGRLGAIGDMAFVLDHHRVDGDLLVIGGDNLFDGQVAGFVEYARSCAGSPVIGIYDIGDTAKASNYGVIKLDAAGRVMDFQEKPAHPESALVGMCLYYFPRETVGLIREYMAQKENKSDAMGFYIDWLRRRTAVQGYVFKGRWYDIGDKAYYDEAQHEFPGDSR